jgi:hypothetical protein
MDDSVTPFWRWFTGAPVTRDDLGNLGGDARFRAPEPDRTEQILQGKRPTAQHTAIYPGWWSL